MKLIATCAFGLEKLVRDELRNLELWTTDVSDGRIEFEADEEHLSEAIIKANLSLRCADRVQIKIGEFEAINFDKLFDATTSLEWEKFIGKNDQFPIQATSAKCILHSEPAIQSIVKKAIATRLQKAHKSEKLPENSDAIYQIVVKGNKDNFLICIDTSGDSLHRRGYRALATEAPIKETLAAALIKLSDWTEVGAEATTSSSTLIDPFCGSGTIAIEAALIAKNIAPGINRHFAFEKWSWINSQQITEIKSTLKSKELQNPTVKILAFDIDPEAIEIAKQNASHAEVEDLITFAVSDFNALDFSHFKNTTFITNPPYGERLEDAAAVTKLYKQIGEKFRSASDYSLFLITSREDFPRLFGRAATKNRKLFNGNLKCYLYSYL